jgi:TonB-linked SusC/RagA family outer membrane protein
MTNLLSFSRFEQEGIVGGDKSQYSRTTIKFNTDINVWEEARTLFSKFKVGANVAYSNVNSRGIEENSEWGSILGSAIMMMPTEGVYEDDAAEIARYERDYPNFVVDKNGRVFNIAGSQEIVNPVADLQTRNIRGWSDKFVAKFFGDINVVENLKFRTSYGADLAFWGDKGFWPQYYLGTTKKKDVSEVWKSNNRGLTWLLENTLMYDKSIGNHNFSVLVGQSAQHSYNEGLYGFNTGLPEAIWNKAYIDFATGTIDDQKSGGGAFEHTLASYFGRLNYNFKEKYLFQFVMRRDGSSNFGPSNRWATFPSVSAGWVLTEEPFMASTSSYLSFLKIRTGWGQNGNERIGQFNYTATLSGGSNYTFGNGTNEVIYNGVKPSKLTNPEVKWETSEQFNIGFDSRWFDGEVSLNADYFKKTTKDMLYTMQVPGHVGDAAPDGNIGSMENKGFEVELGYRPQIGALKLDLSANFTYLKNKVIEIGNEAGSFYLTQHGTGDFVTRAQNGMPYGYFYGWVTDGVFQNQDEVAAYLAKVTPEGQSGMPQPGDIRFKDINGDGFLNDLDRKMIGNPFPELMYGFTISGEIKGFDFRVFMQGVLGNEVYDATRRTDLASMNYSSNILDRWTGEGTSTSIPRMSLTDPNRNIRVSDRFVYDGSYLRMKDLQIGYTLPKALSQKVAMERFRVYVSGTNLVTITDYPGFDPEIGAGFQGVDKGIYPQARTFSVGVNVNF